jgi:hypothetical protein
MACVGPTRNQDYLRSWTDKMWKQTGIELCRFQHRGEPRHTF